VISQPSSKISAPTPSREVRPMLSVVPEESNGRDDHATAGGGVVVSSVVDEIVAGRCPPDARRGTVG